LQAAKRYNNVHNTKNSQRHYKQDRRERIIILVEPHKKISKYTNSYVYRNEDIGIFNNPHNPGKSSELEARARICTQSYGCSPNQCIQEEGFGNDSIFIHLLGITSTFLAKAKSQDRTKRAQRRPPITLKEKIPMTHIRYIRNITKKSHRKTETAS